MYNQDHGCYEGKISKYYAHHKDREIGWDWVYCHVCYPFSDCSTYFDDCVGLGWVEINIEEYSRLKEQGYRERNF